MKTVKVLLAHEYGGRWRKAGASYECEDRFVRALTIARLVAVEGPSDSSPAESRSKTTTYKTRQLKAER